jgi:ParB-like chromosome segregation protein Spo0J
MNKSGKKNSQCPVPMSSEGIWSNFVFLPVDVIDTTWVSLRSGPARVSATDLRDMPIRVVLQDGRYEVVDGFKRLSRWKETGVKQVPALVEQYGDGLSPKPLLLECNSPKRTLGAIDEARVVNSLIEDDGLAVRTVANLLGRRKEWVVGRLALLRLSLPAQQALSTGRINLMVARLLAAIGAEDQDVILAAAEKHSLKMREIQLLIQTWRSASDEEKPGLLADPLFKREQQCSPNYSARLKALEIKLSVIKSALDEFSSLIIPHDLADAEQRRLQAVCASIQLQITQMAEGFKSAGVDARSMSPVIHQNTDFQPEFYDVSEDFYDECKFFPCVPALSPCHLTSSADLRCEI